MKNRPRAGQRNTVLHLYILLIIAALVAYWIIHFAFLAQNRPDEGEIAVHFIDVGQGDAALICGSGGENILIDAGPGTAEQALIAYLDRLGVSTIDYAIFTHPHDDHIGCADTVLREFDVKNVMMPNVPDTNSLAYDNLLSAFEDSKATLVLAIPGSTCTVGEIAFTVLAPNGSAYESGNDHSIVLRLDFGKTRFMFTGDAEMVSESEMLGKFSAEDLKSNVLKVGHHGSSTSTSPLFLAAVDPQIAVISCAKGNDYGHPHKEIRDRLSGRGIDTYRTDRDGTVIIYSDGKHVWAKE